MNTIFRSPVDLSNVWVKLKFHVVDISVGEAAEFFVWRICENNKYYFNS